MAITDYEAILSEAQQLPPAEQQRLATALQPARGGQVIDTETLRALLAQGLGSGRPLTDDEHAAVDAWFDETERLARDIGAAWQSDLTAVEAVYEQRGDQ